MCNKLFKLLSNTVSGVIITALVLMFSATSPAMADGASRIEKGKELAFARNKGNCLACHMIADGELPGNIAPPLIAMKPRFPEFERLVSKISNPLSSNPNSFMPPFGLHNILTEDEIRMIAEYLYTL